MTWMVDVTLTEVARPAFKFKIPDFVTCPSIKSMSDIKPLSRKWGTDEDRVLTDLAVQAGEQLASRWVMIAGEMETRFPGRRLYTPSSVKQHYNGLNVEAAGGPYWTRQERQTLMILCQDNNEDDVDWADIAEQMQMIFDDKKKFTVELIKKRYRVLLKRAKEDASKADGKRRSLENGNPPKRKRSQSLKEAIRPALVLGCDDDDFVPAYHESDVQTPNTANKTTNSKTTLKKAAEQANHNEVPTEGNRAPNLGDLAPVQMSIDDNNANSDATLRMVDEYIEQHMKAMKEPIKLTETCPESLNGTIKNMGVETLSDDDCDVIIQWSIASDSSNTAKWLEHAKDCDANDRNRWPIIVPQCTIYMLQLISSGRLVIVPEKIQSDMDRLHVRLKQLYLQKHSPLYRLLSNQGGMLQS